MISEFKKINNIAFIAHEYGRFQGHGGIASYLEAYANRFVEMQNSEQIPSSLNFYFIYINGNKPNTISKNFPKNVKFIQIPDKLSMGEKLKKISKLIKKHKIDIVEVNDCPALCVHALIKNSIFKNSPGDTYFATMHHTAIREIIEWGNEKSFYESASLKDVINDNYTRLQYFLTDYNLSPSRFLADYISEKYNLNLEVIPYCFDLSNYTCYRIKEISNSPEKIVVYASNFGDRKYQQKLVEASLKLMEQGIENFKVYFIGRDVYSDKHKTSHREYVENLIPDQLRHRFHFYDFLLHEDIRKIYKKAHLFVMTSKYENFPLSVQEAICYGIPVMGSYTTGIRDMVGTELENICCFDFDNTDELADKMLNLLEKSPEYLKELSDKQLDNLKKIIDPEITMKYKFEQLARLRKEKIENKNILYENLKKIIISDSFELNGGINDNELIHLLVIPKKYKYKNKLIKFFHDNIFTSNLKNIIISFPDDSSKAYKIDDLNTDMPYMLPYYESSKSVIQSIKERKAILNFDVKNLNNYEVKE